MNLQKKMHRAKIPVKNGGKMGKATSGRTRCGKNIRKAGRCLDLVQKMLGLCETKNGTKIELLHAGESRHKRVRQDVETNSGT